MNEKYDKPEFIRLKVIKKDGTPSVFLLPDILEVSIEVLTDEEIQSNSKNLSPPAELKESDKKELIDTIITNLIDGNLGFKSLYYRFLEQLGEEKVHEEDLRYIAKRAGYKPGWVKFKLEELKIHTE